MRPSAAAQNGTTTMQVGDTGRFMFSGIGLLRNKKIPRGSCRVVGPQAGCSVPGSSTIDVPVKQVTDQHFTVSVAFQTMGVVTMCWSSDERNGVFIPVAPKPQVLYVVLPGRPGLQSGVFDGARKVVQRDGRWPCSSRDGWAFCANRKPLLCVPILRSAFKRDGQGTCHFLLQCNERCFDCADQPCFL